MAMIYTPKCDDIPSLSQWIKKRQDLACRFLVEEPQPQTNKIENVR